MMCVACFVIVYTLLSLAEAGGDVQKNTEGSGITWTSSLERKIKSIPRDKKEKCSLKRLKHLHQEKVRRKTLIHDDEIDVRFQTSFLASFR